MSKKWVILGTVSFSVGLSLSLIVNKNIKQAALTGLLSVPAAATGVLVLENQRKQQLNDKIALQQRHLKELQQQEKTITTAISVLDLERQRSQQELDTLQNQINDHNKNKSNLEQEVVKIEKKCQKFKQQEKQLLILNQDIKELNSDKSRSQQELDTLQNQINDYNNNKLNLEQEIEAIQYRYQQLQQQEQELIQSKSQVNSEVGQIKQQLFILNQDIKELNSDKSRSQEELDNLNNQIHDQNNNKLNLEQEIEAIQYKYQQLQQQELELRQSLENKLNIKSKLEIAIQSERDRYNQLQQEKSNLENEIVKISTNKQELEQRFEERQQQLKEEIDSLQNKVTSLENQKQTVEQELSEIETDKQQVTDSLIEQQQKLNSIQEEINEKEEHQLELEEELLSLKTQLSKLQSSLNELKSEIEKLERQKNGLFSYLVNPELEELQIEFDFDELEEISQTQDIVIQKLQINPSIETVIKPDNIQQKSQTSSKTNNDDRKNYDLKNILLENDGDHYHLENRESIKNLWESIILPRWRYKDNPTDYKNKFLGNIDIQQKESDRIIRSVGEKLKRFKPITDILEEKNDDLVKIITFALSEYAYYYSEKDEGFWKGFCELDFIHIEHNQIVENTLREIAKKGIDLLKLTKVQEGGYTWVSSLWLQSYVPKRNMDHFATIVQDVADEYGWWEITHSSVGEIHQALLELWENKYKSWRTIGHFLKIAKIDEEDEEAEPISERLVKNIAIVAKELERQGITPEQLQDKEVKHKIDEILNDNNLNLSDSFFLRDWSDLIKVLTPREGKSDRRISKRQNQSPYLYLDVYDSLNIQFILPEQYLSKKEWKNFDKSYCYIPKVNWQQHIDSGHNWEGHINNDGSLEISELMIDITQVKEQWTCQLQNHNREEIYKWEHDGINYKLPCLVFDAISGKHIKIDIYQPNIIGMEEIVVFTPEEIEIEVESIKIINKLFPSIISGWQGKKIRLLSSEALIQIQDEIITWKLQEQEQPQLIGLRLKGRKLVYLNTPSLYYPPQEQDITINCLIESIDKKEIIARNCFTLLADNNWTEIDLSQCIKEAGNYQATFWQQEKTWSYRFEVREEYQITHPIVYRNLEIYDRDNNLLSIPAKCENTDQFWAKVIKINNLYPLEKLTFKLKNDSQEDIFQKQADSSGQLTLPLTSLEHCLSKCDLYSLDFKQSGSGFRTILHVGYLLNCQITATEVIFEKLAPQNNYYLSGWNLLIPDKQPEIINFSSSHPEQTIVNLSFSPGIYHIQLGSDNQLIENIGLWCHEDQYKIITHITQEIEDNKALADYCYAILDNESLENFSKNLAQLNINFNKETIQIILVNLYESNYYLPKWLNKDSLNQKIQKILENLLNS